MRRSLKTLSRLVPGLVLAVGATWCASSLAQQGGQPGNNKPGNSDSSSHRERRGDDRDDRREKDRDGKSGDDEASPDRVLQSYQSYRERAGKGGEQTRREIERRVKELTDLIEMRYQMTLTMAAVRAEQRRGPQGMPGMPMMPQLGAPGQYAGGPGQGQPPGDESSDDRALRTREALARDLEQINTQVRGEIDQARGAIDALAAQLKAVREQQRTQARQEKAQREQESKAKDAASEKEGRREKSSSK